MSQLKVDNFPYGILNVLINLTFGLKYKIQTTQHAEFNVNFCHVELRN